MTYQILSAPTPRLARAGNAAGMDVEASLLAEADPSSADSLVSSNDPDDLANEQTWPTEEEMNGAPNESPELPDAVQGTTPKAVRRIPKGMSEYQAAWILDDDEDEEGGDDTGVAKDANDADMEPMEEEEMEDLPMDDAETDLDRREKVHFEDLDIEEEEKQ